MRSVASTFTCTSCIPSNRSVLLSTSGCLSVWRAVSLKDCLSLWRTVCLVKGLSVFWKDCLSFGRTVCRENFLSLGRTVCLFVQRISSLSERLSLKDSLSVSPSPWRIFCLSEKLSASLKDCLSLYLRRLSVFTVFSVCLSTCLCLYVCQSFWAPLSASIRPTCYVCPSVAVS